MRSNWVFDARDQVVLCSCGRVALNSLSMTADIFNLPYGWIFDNDGAHCNLPSHKMVGCGLIDRISRGRALPLKRMSRERLIWLTKGRWMDDKPLYKK